MSDIPNDADPGGEELDLGEIDEAEGDAEGQEGGDEDAADDEGPAGEGREDEEGEGRRDVGREARTGRKSQSQRLRDRNEQLQRELAEARGFRQAAEQFRPQQQQQADPAAQARAQQERADRLAMMSPVEAAEYIANERAGQFQQALLMQHLNTQDLIDKRDYDSQARSSRLHSQYREEVERTLREKRQAGDLLINREEILDRIIGREARQRASRAAPVQRGAARRRVGAQQTRPTGARGDGPSGGRRPQPGSAEDDERIIAEGFARGERL